MADVSKAGTPSLASLNPPQSSTINGLKAGEAIEAGDACYIKSDGKVYLSDGEAAGAAAVVDGFALVDTPVGEAVSLYFDVNIRYGSGLTPGDRYYVSGTTPGGLVDAPSTGGIEPVAMAIDATRIRVWQSRYTEAVIDHSHE